MLKIKVYNQEGKEVGEEELDPAVFGVAVKPELVQQAVVAQMAKDRVPLAHTKTRGEVRGGGIKPWRQKGTGRARVGSIRSPLWRGGGVVFGPRKERVFAKKINKKAKRKALLMCLSDKVDSGWMVVLDKLELVRGKTKEMKEVLSKLPIHGKRSGNKNLSSAEPRDGVEKPKIQTKKFKNIFLIALEDKNENVMRATRNIIEAATIRADSLNVIDLLKYKYFLVTKEGIKKIEKVYGKEGITN